MYLYLARVGVSCTNRRCTGRRAWAEQHSDVRRAAHQQGRQMRALLGVVVGEQRAPRAPLVRGDVVSVGRRRAPVGHAAAAARARRRLPGVAARQADMSDGHYGSPITEARRPDALRPTVPPPAADPFDGGVCAVGGSTACMLTAANQPVGHGLPGGADPGDRVAMQHLGGQRAHTTPGAPARCLRAPPWHRRSCRRGSWASCSRRSKSVAWRTTPA
jgi:hypothetical protein